MPSPSDWFTAITELAPGLRRAGVLEVAIGEMTCQVKLAPWEPVTPVETEPLPEHTGDPLQDPATYGRADGMVPGFQRPPDGEDPE